MNVRLAVVLLMLCPPVTAEDYPFNRIFTDDRERRIINRIADSEPIEEQVREASRAAPDEAPVAPDAVTFSGVHHRSGHSPLYWVDGQSELTNDQALPFLPRRQSDGGARFFVEGLEATLKPGQTWHIGQGLVLEPWELRRPQPAATETETSAGNQ